MLKTLYRPNGYKGRIYLKTLTLTLTPTLTLTLILILILILTLTLSLIPTLTPTAMALAEEQEWAIKIKKYNSGINLGEIIKAKLAEFIKIKIYIYNVTRCGSNTFTI